MRSITVYGKSLLPFNICPFISASEFKTGRFETNSKLLCKKECLSYKCVWENLISGQNVCKSRDVNKTQYKNNSVYNKL